MSNHHWSDEELVARLYDVGPEDCHLDTCASCARRWEEIRCRHADLRPAGIEVPSEFLSAQKRAIHERLLQKPSSLHRVLVPVLVTILLAMTLIVYRQGPEEPPAVEQITDDQLFDDVFRIVSRTEPGPVGPIRSLFEEQE